MVIVQIHSGLGNQMFQYAAGKALADKLKVPLKLDISWFEHASSAQTPNEFQLNLFPGVIESYASKTEVDSLIRPSSKGFYNRLRHKINRSRPIHKQWDFVEPHFHFYNDFFKATSPVHLTGYWQSEKYFGTISESIRAVFTIEFIDDNYNQELLKEIQSGNAVSLHVRRGDMVNNPLVVATHGSCDLNYYKTAMHEIESLVKKPHYYIFSDDPEWCRENLHSVFPITFVTGNTGKKAYLDIQLMSRCKHHIIANSSFSWWGAWLNRSMHKHVIAPRKWFATNEKNTNDLIPSDWIRI
jgi:hypothetical protein